MRSLFLALMLLPLMSSAQKLELPDLNFLLGEWYVPALGIYENWYQDDEGFYGDAFRLKDGERIPFESFRIKPVDGVPAYVVTVGGEEPVAFKLISVEGSMMVFSNPENEFPTQISYWKNGDYPMARLEGKQGGQELSMDFEFVLASDADEHTTDLDAKIPSESTLGEQYYVNISTANLDENVDFFQKLGFEKIKTSSEPHPHVLMFDGALYVMIRNSGPDSYFDINYLASDMAERKKALKARGLKFDMEMESAVSVSGFMDINEKMGFVFVDAVHPDIEVAPIKSEGALGTLGEIAIPVADYEKASGWYQSLGFAQLSSYTTPYPWGIYSDGLVVIGLHESLLFDKPAITYFSMKSPEHIKRLQAEGIEVTDVFKTSDEIQNGVITTPDGWPINIFFGEL
jgi:predicted lactoylglutathione lyase